MPNKLMIDGKMRVIDVQKIASGFPFGGWDGNEAFWLPVLCLTGIPCYLPQRDEMRVTPFQTLNFTQETVYDNAKYV